MSEDTHGYSCPFDGDTFPPIGGSVECTCAPSSVRSSEPEPITDEEIRQLLKVAKLVGALRKRLFESVELLEVRINHHRACLTWEAKKELYASADDIRSLLKEPMT